MIWPGRSIVAGVGKWALRGPCVAAGERNAKKRLWSRPALRGPLRPLDRAQAAGVVAGCYPSLKSRGKLRARQGVNDDGDEKTGVPDSGVVFEETGRVALAGFDQARRLALAAGIVTRMGRNGLPVRWAKPIEPDAIGGRPERASIDGVSFRSHKGEAFQMVR